MCELLLKIYILITNQWALGWVQQTRVLSLCANCLHPCVSCVVSTYFAFMHTDSKQDAINCELNLRNMVALSVTTQDPKGSQCRNMMKSKMFRLIAKFAGATMWLSVMLVWIPLGNGRTSLFFTSLNYMLEEMLIITVDCFPIHYDTTLMSYQNLKKKNDENTLFCKWTSPLCATLYIYKGPCSIINITVAIKLQYEKIKSIQSWVCK